MNTAPCSARPLLTPAQIVARLDERVVGQDLAKRKLAGALWWNHYRRLLGGSGIDAATLPPRRNVLLAGPSGTGKTLLVRSAAELFGAPCFITAATSYSRVGYVGLNPEDMIAGLLQAAGGDVALAETGIVLLDEVDKLRKRDLGQDDVGGDAVQHMLLTLLEGSPMLVKRPGGDDRVAVDTAGITFIASGAFAGLEEVVLRRLRRGHDIDGRSLDEDAYRHLSADDLVGYGLIPEFVARFPVRAGLVPLRRDQLDYLLRDAPGSPLGQLVRLFELHGIELVVEDSAALAVLDLAVAENTGARALAEVLDDRLLHVINGLPEMLADGVTRVIVDADTVRQGAAAWHIAGEPVEALVDLGIMQRLTAQPMPSAAAGPAISNTRGWSDERIRARLEIVKGALDWGGTTGSARKWWDGFERDNSHRLGLVLRLAEELAVRKATIADFFLAYVYSNTDNIQANLSYLDYTRLKKEEERHKRDRARAPAAGRFRTGDACPATAAGTFQFDGYLDGSGEPGPDPDARRITLEASQVFPPAGAAGKPCWWKRAAAQGHA
jgi:ATP-dependent Clp protease ATP-binding subunit ClpX